ncbi:MAG: branched-chain amino acid aminotransferase [Ekhidna sp.]|nr:branched-chain amino acid aminotransferase [Ekhidna sp.]MBC6409398.1 branched-chain amino acid aminotransferase [Ekhidna sp.]
MTDTLDIQIQKTQKSKLSKVDIDNPEFGKLFSDHMFLADYRDGEWQNLRITPYQHFTISPANATLHYAQSIFEGLKAHKNKDGEILVFRPDANAKRLIKSAERMCMPPVPQELFLEAIDNLVALDKGWVPDKPGTALYIRPFQFADDSFIRVKASETYKFMVITGPVGGYYSEPVKVKIEKQFTRASKGGVGYAKTAGNYAASLYPAKKANEQGYHQLIWTDGQNHEFIEESGTMNIMFVIDGKLITPPTSDSILPGITRESALTLARDWGVNVEERPIKVKEVVKAIQNKTLTEAFGIGTAATISHIQTIGYEGEDFELSPIVDREISNKLLDTLTKIKLGKAEDTYGWIRKIG